MIQHIFSYLPFTVPHLFASQCQSLTFKFNAVFSVIHNALLNTSQSAQIWHNTKRLAAAINPPKAEDKQNKNILNQTKHPTKLHTSQSNSYKYKLHINTQI